MIDDVDVGCLRDADCLDPEVRALGTQLVACRALLDALAEPMRQDLVQVLARSELNVANVADRVTVSRPTVSHHLNVLRRAGLVRARKRGREMYYRLNKDRIVGSLHQLIDCLTCC
ncbi:MAG: helix-turn-helix transcriptional regulator [Chloroflexi bacterium]|nr:helix-turn-helix transcriptional regulator [Chloroflexota bacterium]